MTSDQKKGLEAVLQGGNMEGFRQAIGGPPYEIILDNWQEATLFSFAMKAAQLRSGSPVIESDKVPELFDYANRVAMFLETQIQHLDYHSRSELAEIIQAKSNRFVLMQLLVLFVESNIRQMHPDQADIDNLIHLIELLSDSIHHSGTDISVIPTNNLIKQQAVFKSFIQQLLN